MFIRNIFQRILPTANQSFEVQACPNCWGVSQWAGKDCPQHFDIDKGAASEVNSRNGFIRNFVKRFIG